MDGLLIDSEKSIMRSWIEAAAQKGVCIFEEDYAQVIGASADDSQSVLVDLLGGIELFEEVRDLTISKIGVSFPVKPGAGRLLGFLNRIGVGCAVASSSTRTEIRDRLASVDLTRYFDVFVSSEDVSRGKPHPEIYELASDLIGIDSRRCLVFEDSENGARAAIGAGAGLILVPDIAPVSSEVRDCAVAVFDTLDHSFDHVSNLFTRAEGI